MNRKFRTCEMKSKSCDIKYFYFPSNVSITVKYNNLMELWSVERNDNDGNIITGFGDTREEAFADLRENLQQPDMYDNIVNEPAYHYHYTRCFVLWNLRHNPDARKELRESLQKLKDARNFFRLYFT